MSQSLLLLLREGGVVTAWHPMGVPIRIAEPDVARVQQALGHADQAVLYGAVVSLEEEGLTVQLEPYEWSLDRPLPDPQELYADWYTPSFRYKLYGADGGVVRVERLAWQHLVEGFSPHCGCCRMVAHIGNNHVCKPRIQFVEPIAPVLFSRAATGLLARRVSL